MPTEILMPALSPTMEEGTLAKWHVREGDEVRTGDVIAEIETDKATMEVEAIDDGRVGKILVAEGTEHVPVNKPIALLLTDGEDSARPGETPHHPRRRGLPASDAAELGRSVGSDQVGTAVQRGQMRRRGAAGQAPPAPASRAPNRGGSARHRDGDHDRA